RMFAEGLPAARFEPFAITLRRIVISAEFARALRDAHRFGFPQGESVHGARGPRQASLAMAITHRTRRAGHCELNRAAEARAFVCFLVAHDDLLIDCCCRFIRVLVSAPGFYS